MGERRGISIWLAASLALNAALVGVVGGRILAQAPADARDARDGRERLASGRQFREMSGEERRALRRDLAQVWRTTGEERKAVGDARRRAAELASADPFDADALAEALEDIRTAEIAAKAKLHAAVLGRFDELTPEERVRLLQFVERPPRTNRGPPRDRQGGPPPER